ncbi:PepSY domain-containing protein [Listeria fleischmannii]|uniref:PepSY domain-containing protein n=1 Tax=Listeria fleischmannii TaxID=1069827 RepID=UPI0002B9ED69|nr:PepSY domain-containing protein [Listeria fleischmannii]EMG26938.1 cell surface protein [Listeria fleischmannii subsp. fleischmannii LU2006-1]
MVKSLNINWILKKVEKFYEVEVIKGNTKYSFDIGVKDSRIYSYEEKVINSTTTSAKKTKEITAQEAGRIAVQKAGGGKVVSSKVDYDNGKKVYDVEVQNGNVKHEVKVGVSDSKIYKYEKETVKTASNSKQNTHANTKTVPKNTTPNTATTKKPASDITLANAQQIALSKTGGGRVVSAYTDYDDGRKEYDFKIINGDTEYELEIGASDSKVYKFEKEVIRKASNKNQASKAPSGQTKSQTNPPANNTQSNGISLARAQQIALSKTGGGRVVSSSVDYDDGRKEYEFDIVKGNIEYDVTVGADSKIYDFDQDTVDYDD